MHCGARPARDSFCAVRAVESASAGRSTRALGAMDSYDRLRPHTDDSACDCASIDRLLLVDILTSNPMRCFKCKGYVDPKRIAMTEGQVEAVASWERVFSALYQLWLDSGEYEISGKQQVLLSDVRGNGLGMAAPWAVT